MKIAKIIDIMKFFTSFPLPVTDWGYSGAPGHYSHFVGCFTPCAWQKGLAPRARAQESAALPAAGARQEQGANRLSDELHEEFQGKAGKSRPA